MLPLLHVVLNLDGQAALAPPWLELSLLATWAIYLRGFLQLYRRGHPRLQLHNAFAFSAGIAVLLVAVSATVDGLVAQSLRSHMAQHVLLMMVAPPLLWLGAPLAPLICGLPRAEAQGLARLLANPRLRRLGHWLSHPLTAGLAFAGATWTWHTPILYDLALRSELWHGVEHACFLLSALLFWWPVIQPWPGRAAWPRWAIVPYLLFADLQNTVLSAILTFSGRVLYPAYAAGGLSDQAAAGVIMWVPGSIAYLLPLAWIVFSQLTPASVTTSRASADPRVRA